MKSRKYIFGAGGVVLAVSIWMAFQYVSFTGNNPMCSVYAYYPQEISVEFACDTPSDQPQDIRSVRVNLLSGKTTEGVIKIN